MAEFTQSFQQMAGGYIDHPIVDATGLEGEWDFVIGWTPKAVYGPQPRLNATPPDRAVVQASEPNGISAFNALEKQLALKLVKQKRSIPVIVVDHVSEKPIE